MTDNPNKTQYLAYIGKQLPIATAFFKQYETETSWSAEKQAMHSVTISGSKIGAIVGDCKYRTPLDVFLDMTLQKAPFGGNYKTRRGQAMEHEIAFEAAEVLHGKLGGGLNLSHPEKPYFTCQIDETIKTSTLGAFPCECKWIGFPTSDWGKGSNIDAAGNIITGDSQIPRDYYDQVMWQLGLMKACYGDKAPAFAILAAIIKNEPQPRIYIIHFDEELFNSLCEKAEAFLFENIIAGVAPEMTEEEVKKLEQADNKKKKTVEGDFINLDGDKSEKEIFEASLKYSQINAQINELKKELEEVKTQLIASIGEHEGVMCYGNLIATYKTTKDKVKFNEKLFAEKHPDLYEQFSEKVQGSRVFSNKL